jgi:hypothetical protein
MAAPAIDVDLGHTEPPLRLRTLAGEQAQADWGYFGRISINRAIRTLMGFIMVLSYSRDIFLHFFLNACIENFLRGHIEAFSAWDGVPRVILYDNLKSVVLERHGDAIRFNPTLLEFSRHYRFEPRPVAIARGNEKGRVERALRYVRDSFFAGRKFVDLNDLNAQAKAWCREVAAARRCPGQPSLSVQEALAEAAPATAARGARPRPCRLKSIPCQSDVMNTQGIPRGIRPPMGRDGPQWARGGAVGLKFADDPSDALTLRQGGATLRARAEKYRPANSRFLDRNYQPIRRDLARIRHSICFGAPHSASIALAPSGG